MTWCVRLILQMTQLMSENKTEINFIGKNFFCKTFKKQFLYIEINLFQFIFFICFNFTFLKSFIFGNMSQKKEEKQSLQAGAESKPTVSQKKNSVDQKSEDKKSEYEKKKRISAHAARRALLL